MSSQEQKAASTNAGTSLSAVGDATSLKGKFTPGPWRNERGSGAYGRNVTADNGRRIVCETICSDHDANARLIAAAPDLLAACEAALRVLESEPECAIYKAHTEIVQAAIVKARGEAQP